jgi:hypothetical protein
MSFLRLRQFGCPLAVSVTLSLFATPILESSRLPGKTSQSIIAEGTYVYGSASNPTREHWVLSKTAEGRYIAEGHATQNTPETEILKYRLEMDSKLHPSLVELHTIMDYPSYTCKLAAASLQCSIAYEDPNPETRGQQNAQMAAPFDLFGFHSYGWIFSSIVGRLPPGQSHVTVHLFLPNEDRYPNAVAEVRRETPASVTVAGKTVEAQRFTVKLIMDASDVSSTTVWTSRSGLVLKMQDTGEPSPGGDLPVVELTSYKQAEGFIPEMQ